MPATVIYARKSTESDDRQVLSIDSQIRELGDFAARQGLKVERTYKESMSAKSPGRPVMSEIFRRIQAGEIDQLVCWKLDRLARNPVDGGALIWAFEERKLGKIHTPQRTFENTGNDKFWMQLEFGMAKKYVDDLSDNVRRGLREKLERGWYPNRPPTGYVNDVVSKTIVPDPERFELVQRMWELMLTGNYSPPRILQIATEEWGLRTKRIKTKGGRPLAPSAIYKIFTQPFYYGVMEKGGIIYKGQHKPMISAEEFDRVQEMLGLKAKPRPHKYKFAYTGMIRCGECGSAITAENRVQRQGHRYVYYHCTKRRRDYKCSQPYIQVEDLERQIASFLSQITVSKRIVEWAAWLLREQHESESGRQEAQRNSLRRRHDEAGRELDRLLDLKLRALISDEGFVTKRNSLELERSKLEELLADNGARLMKVMDDVLESFQFAQSASERFEKGTIDDRRAILRYTGLNLTLTDGILRIEPQKPLLLIKNALAGPELQMLAFEPVLLRQSQREKARLEEQVGLLRGLVENIRTFVMQEHMESAKVGLNRA